MPRVVVIGAGAAGTMAAIFAAAGGAETILVERTRDGGRKILISGGGRCNILPVRLDESRFVTDSSPHTLRRILRSWPLAEQIAFFERDAGIALVEETESAKLFPASHRARDVRDGLLALARRNGVQLVMDTEVTGLSSSSSRWLVECRHTPPLDADAVIVATGGLSVPQTGSDGAGLRVAESLGHQINTTYAALTPLTAQPAPYAALSGVSLPVTVTARTSGKTRSATATGGFLFTHTGYSGPAVLDISHVPVRARLDHLDETQVLVQWTTRGEQEWTEALKPRGTRTVVAALREVLPARLAETLGAAAGIEPGLMLAHLTRDARRRLIDVLVRSELPWTGDEGYRKAEVTGGGVDLSEVDPRTLESRRHKGLFLCGEMLDAFGPIGGYNFYWAWCTGRLAGIGAARVS